MMTLTSTKILWIAVFSVGLVSTIHPTEAAGKGAINLVGQEDLHQRRMLRHDPQKPPLVAKPVETVEEVVETVEEVVETVEEDVETVEEDVETVTDTNLNIDALSNETMVDEIIDEPDEAFEESVDYEEVERYSSNVALASTRSTTPVNLPLFTFIITTDSNTEEIDTPELTSVLSDYLLEQLQDKFPESYLVQVDFDVDYKYKPEKEEVDGVGFAADNEDSVHIFNATGTALFHNSSTEIPTENQVFAKARDSMLKNDAEATILSLLQENTETSLHEAKSFSVSELKPREATYLVQDMCKAGERSEGCDSTPRTVDILIGLTAVLILLTGAYVARDKVKGMSGNQQETQESFDDDEESVSYKKRGNVVVENEETLGYKTKKKNFAVEDDAETLPPTPPPTPSTASTRKSQLINLSPATQSTSSIRKSQLITLSDFNIIDELSHLGDDGTNKNEYTNEGNGKVNNIESQQKRKPHRKSILKSSIRRSSSRKTRQPATRYADAPRAASTQHCSPQLITLSDFNLLDEIMCMGKEMGVESANEQSRRVQFDVETDSTRGDTALRIFDCGPVELADGVKIDRDGKPLMSKKDNSSGFGLFDMNVFGIGDDDDYRSGTRSGTTSSDNRSRASSHDYRPDDDHSYDDRPFDDYSRASSYYDDDRSRGSIDSEFTFSS